jgi:6-phosphogluconate dehydrogenase
LQKPFKAVYYPRVVTFSQGVTQIAETLHKFTLTYPCTITLWHSGNLLVASGGQVVSQEFNQPMRVWSGEVAAREAVWQIWDSDAIQATATSWVDLSE